MTESTLDTLAKRIGQQMPQWRMKVIGINFANNTVAVAFGGSVMERVRLARHYNVGTPADPNVAIGDEVIVTRAGEEYIITTIL